ncbi:MAG: flagellar basal-body MS-ring/collar protein FliF [Bryobacteraceae bacterium]|jgi:flagellar M-ring protein FliF
MNQLQKLAADLTVVQRVSVAAAVLITGGAIAALLHYRHEGDFRPLYTAMAPEDAAPVVQKLKESGVEYRLSDGGSVVLVPSARLADSRLTLASAGLPKSGRIGFELFDKTNFGATELVEHINHQRALEGELERSVMSMAEVVQARVHLTFPRESVFLDQQQPAKASVMVKLRPGARISAQNVLAVSNLVASAVEGLTPDAVAVIDMDGNLLSRPKRVSSGDSQVTSEALEVRQQIERDLVAKISATLEPLLGSDQFRAGASVDCDLTSGEQQEETYNPDQSVMLTSQKSEDVNERASAGGIPGTAANLPNPPAPAKGGGGSSHKTENVTYQSSRVIRHTRIPQGVVRRMSLSVLVGQPAHWEGSGKSRRRVMAPPPPETMKTIRDLVAGVTGFNADRGDQLIVESLPFESGMMEDAMQSAPSSAPKPDLEPAWLMNFTRYRDVVFTAVGGLVLLSILIKLVLRYMPGRAFKATTERVSDELEAAAAMRHVAAQESSAGVAGVREPAGVAAESLQLLAQTNAESAERVRQFAQKEPAVSANVLRMWLHDQNV